MMGPHLRGLAPVPSLDFTETLILRDWPYTETRECIMMLERVHNDARESA